MVYEGNVKVISDDGKTFTFDSPEAVAWLQMYVDMVKAGTVDNTVLTTDRRPRRPAALLGRPGAVLPDRPEPHPRRQVRTTPTLYDNLAVAPAPLGKSGVAGKGLMGISVKTDTKFPNASIALAQFFTNPRSMVEFAKMSRSTRRPPSAYRRPVLLDTPDRDRGQRPARWPRTSSRTTPDIVPTIPKKADVNDDRPQGGRVRRCSATVPAQQALTDAVAKANELLQ